jgi:hypothetical protein
MMPTSPTPHFHLMRTPQATARLDFLCRRAGSIGMLPTFLNLVKAIERYLTTIPREWGDPIWQLPGLKMVVYSRLIEQLLVVYAVHEQEPLAWLRSITPVLNHPLASSQL